MALIKEITQLPRGNPEISLITSNKVSSTKIDNNNDERMIDPVDMEVEVASLGGEERVQKLPFQTLVFFDLEATGLRSSTSKARITELAFVAVNTSEFVELQAKLASSPDVESVSPRVANRLSLCVNPCALIMPNVTDLTGLDNYNLESQRSFSSHTAKLVSLFLDHLPKPFCLVAHNGNGFDFPLLRSELNNSGSNIDSGALVVDSLEALRFILMQPVGQKNDDKDLRVAASETDLFFPPLDMSDENQVFSHREVLEETQCPSGTSTPVKRGRFGGTYHIPDTPPDLTPKRPRCIDHEDEVSSATSPTSSESQKEDVRVLATPNSTDDIRYDNEATPDKSLMMEPITRPQAPIKSRKFLPASSRWNDTGRARKRLDFSTTPPTSFSLPKLHEHIFGKLPESSHGAESDCMALMRVCAYRAKPFVSFIEQHAQPFSDTVKMW